MSSATPTPPGTPRPASKWASRMGAAIRRSSTVLSVARPSTPSAASDPDSDSKSLRRSTSRPDISAVAPVVSPPKQTSPPTPISESPAREAAAIQQQEVVGPSPLVQPTADTASASEPINTTSPEPVQPASQNADEQATSPVGYVPPPVIDSSVGNPGAFTDLPEELPQPTEVQDPYAATNTGPPPPEPVAPEPPVQEEAPAPAQEEVSAPAPPVQEEVSAPPEYVPPPVIDSSIGNPGAYADELPQPTETRDPYAATSPDPPAANGHAAEETLVDEPAAEAPALEQSTSYFDKPMAESMLDFDPNEPEHNDSIEALAESGAVSRVEEQQPEEPDYEHGEAAAYYKDGPPMPVAEPHVHEPAPAAEEPSAAPEPAGAETREVEVPAPAPAPAPAPVFGAAVMPSYDLPGYTSHDVWGGVSREEQPHEGWTPAVMPQPQLHEEPEAQPVYVGTLPIPIPIPVPANEGELVRQGNGSIHSVASSFKMPNPHPEVLEDPFADPVPPIIAIARSEDGPYGTHPQISEPPPQVPLETHEDVHNKAIVMPLPAFSEVIPSNSMHRVPSQQSSFGGNKANLETDERIPLLARPVTPNKRPNSYLQIAGAPNGNNYSSISPLASTSWNHHHTTSSPPRLHELGWLEYHLPDGTVYYVHPTRRIVTDVNLRAERFLIAAEAWLDETRDESLDVGVESWLREAKDTKRAGKASAARGKKTEVAVHFERCWIDHHARTVVKEDEQDRRAIGYGRGHVHGHGGHGKGKQAGTTTPKHDEDQLDMEYRFWSYMEAHPAHTPLPHKAQAEAMDVLTWAWTEQLLPSYRPIPAPFAQDECQELRTLLHSFGKDHHDDHGMQTRVVSRILLRVAHWRQMYFRPNKPLPKDVGPLPHQLPIQRRPFRRAMFDFLVSCLCLGIPYLFYERARLSSRVDQESGMFRNSSAMVVIGAATCVVAAIVLTASVTFLALPGLDNVARTAGLVAILFSTFSMAATGVAILRHKADLERPVSRIAGIEGLMIISRRSVAMSLPLVLLSYAVIAFVVGIVLYSFRGAPVHSPTSRQTSFEDYMKWTVVGVVGALAGILTTSMVIL